VSQQPAQQPSLMDDLGAAPAVPAERWAERADRVLRRALRSRGLWAVVAAGGAVLASWGVSSSWRTLFPRATPNVAEGDIEDALDFALLSGDFNRLSVDERLRIVRELLGRMRSGSADDSALVAAFAAGISGAAREQLRTNAEQLFVDVWADYAVRYTAVSAKDREKFLEEAFASFSELGEELSGVSSGRNAEERLKDAKEDAQRDQQRLRGEDRGLSAERAGRFFGFMTGRGLGKTTPAQRDSMQRMQRDMVRYLRGQDLDTGRPRPGG
jgi:hypothetical protein